ncbi:MAG: MarC family protein [Candidatus Micrarchaeota archaeon]|nr:MarC family protein [Candidatus Micrarchaeota archaeon]
MADFISSVLISFVTIFVIMDPFPSLIPFLEYTKKCSDNDRRTCATNAVVIAGIIAVVFMFVGPTLLSYLNLSISNLKIAGGIVLVLLGIETVLGISFGNHNKKENINDVAILIATPLLTGPGLVSTLIILSESNGFLITLVALVFALLVSWFVLVGANTVKKIAGDQFIHVLAKIIGLLLLALGVAYIRTGLLG